MRSSTSARWERARDRDVEVAVDALRAYFGREGYDASEDAAVGVYARGVSD